jgi:hypothetical protein
MARRTVSSPLDLIWNDTRHSVARGNLMNSTTIFDRPGVWDSDSYLIRSRVTQEVVTTFVEAIEGAGITITNENLFGLLSLSEEFGFRRLTTQCEEFKHANPGYADAVQPDSFLRIISLEDRVTRQERSLIIQDRQITDQQSQIQALVASQARLTASLEAALAELQELHGKTQALDTRFEHWKPGAAVSPNQSLTFLLKEGCPLEGIIAHFTKFAGGNVHDRGIVIITSGDGYADPTFPAKNAADLEVDSFFHSDGTKNEWICYDFLNRRITPSHYTIRSKYNGQVGGSNLKSWVIEGSIDAEEWVELDRQEASGELNGPGLIVTLPVTESIECQCIRLRSVGKNHANLWDFIISAFEIFGEVK